MVEIAVTKASPCAVLNDIQNLVSFISLEFFLPWYFAQIPTLIWDCIKMKRS